MVVAFVEFVLDFSLLKSIEHQAIEMLPGALPEVLLALADVRNGSVVQSVVLLL